MDYRTVPKSEIDSYDVEAGDEFSIGAKVAAAFERGILLCKRMFLQAMKSKVVWGMKRSLAEWSQSFFRVVIWLTRFFNH